MLCAGRSPLPAPCSDNSRSRNAAYPSVNKIHAGFPPAAAPAAGVPHATMTACDSDHEAA